MLVTKVAHLWIEGPQADRAEGLPLCTLPCPISKNKVGKAPEVHGVNHRLTLAPLHRNNMPPRHEQCIVGQWVGSSRLSEALPRQRPVGSGEGEGLEGLKEVRRVLPQG